jgi:MltA specific insert domain
MAKNLKSAGSRIYSICSPLRLKARGASSLEDGTPLRVNYDSHNGYSFTSISRALIERNLIPREEMSMQRIREWMAAHPRRGSKGAGRAGITEWDNLEKAEAFYKSKSWTTSRRSDRSCVPLKRDGSQAARC